MLALSLAAHDPERCAPGSWQRIGGGSPPRGRFSQPPRPPSDARGSAREGSREAFTGETTGQVLSCETGLIPRCRSPSVEEKATSSHGEWLAWEEPRADGDLVHVEKFFARNLGGLIHARTRVPGQLGKATSGTP